MELHDITTGYLTSHRRVVIERDINLNLNQGEFTCLLGPNGAGKTTLLRTLAGFIPPLEGYISIDGKHLAAYTQAELSKIISVVLTERPSVSSMTVEQLVSLGRSPYTGFWGRVNDQDRKIAEKAMETTGTTGLRERLVDTLSDGERQKVMIAKALAQETPIILLDEPTAFLDFPSKAETMQLLARLAHDHNKTILQSTHDLNMALAIADRIWLMDKKLGVASGTPRELSDNGTLESYFLRQGISFNRANISFSVDKA